MATAPCRAYESINQLIRKIFNGPEPRFLRFPHSSLGSKT
jgi:hypothetical protein